MKAYLSFNLPQEKEEHKDALAGSTYKFILQDLDNHLRGVVKHSNLEEAVLGVHQEIRDKLHELCSENDVSLWS